MGSKERLAAIDAALALDSAVLLEQCEAHAAQAGDPGVGKWRNILQMRYGP